MAGSQCTGTSSTTGERCRAYAIEGGTVCRRHGGALPSVARVAAIRKELDYWYQGDTSIDPGEQLLRLVSQSAARCVLYAKLLQELYETAELIGDDAYIPGIKGGTAALIGAVYASTPDGRVYQTSEQIRAMVLLEAQERDRCAKFAALAISAGLAERAVRVAEQQAQMIVEAVSIALDRAGVTGEARIQAQNAAADHLVAISS